MNARQMAAMAKATRLTRQGRLLEATALIQQTLASPAVTRRTPEAPCDEEEAGAVVLWQRLVFVMRCVAEPVRLHMGLSR